MPNSAIPPDVPAAAAEAEIPKSPRELAMEEIENRHQQEMATSNGYELPADDGDHPAAAAPADPVPDQLAAQLAAPPDPGTDEKYKVKIDGEDGEATMEEMRREYQKGKTADKRLAEATRLLREAQEAEATRLLRNQQEAQTRAQQQAPATEPAPNVEADASGKDFLKALFEGDEENALSALQRVMEGRQPQQQAAPILDIDQITSAVTQHVQQKLVVESALAQNRHDYPELYADPDMEGLALAKIQRMREQEGTDFFVALDAVSREFATKFGWTPPAAPGRQVDPAPTTSPRAAKLEAKRSIDNVTAINTKTTSTEQQPENPSDVIAAMKAARGG